MRQIHKITDSQWIDELDTNNLELTNKLDTLNKSLSTELMRVLDTLAPEKECKINLRTKRPWYDADLKEHKCQVRKLEKNGLSIRMRVATQLLRSVAIPTMENLMLRRRVS